MVHRPFVSLVVIVAILASFWYCNNKPDEQAAQVEEQRETALSISENSAAFNQSFGEILSAYYALNEALFAADTARANAASAELAKQAADLQVDEIQGDTSGMIRETAKVFTATISESANTLASQSDIEAKRRQYEAVTDAVWSLTRTVRYDAQKVYYQYCPTAFNNKGAYWLSSDRQIRNPYFGSKMPECGETADSLDYSKR